MKATFLLEISGLAPDADTAEVARRVRQWLERSMALDVRVIPQADPERSAYLIEGNAGE